MAHYSYPDDWGKLLERIAELEAENVNSPTRARNQPCGCLVCICANDEQCQGCGALNCKTVGCVFTEPGQPRIAWEDHPLVKRAEAAEAKLKKRGEWIVKYVAKARKIESERDAAIKELSATATKAGHLEAQLAALVGLINSL